MSRYPKRNVIHRPFHSFNMHACMRHKHAYLKKVVGCKFAGQVRCSFFPHRHHPIDQITHFQLSCVLSTQLNLPPLLLPV